MTTENRISRRGVPRVDHSMGPQLMIDLSQSPGEKWIEAFYEQPSDTELLGLKVHEDQVIVMMFEQEKLDAVMKSVDLRIDSANAVVGPKVAEQAALDAKLNKYRKP